MFFKQKCIWGGEFGVWSLEFGVWSLEFGRECGVVRAYGSRLPTRWPMHGRAGIEEV